MKLTIGMAVYGDFVGAYFTVEALRLYHDLADTEILIIDGCADDNMRNWVKQWHGQIVRYEQTVLTGTAQPRDLVFQRADGDWVICIDPHVLLAPNAVKLFKEWADQNRSCFDLLHGPMLYDGLTVCTTHMEPVWRDNMWGIWAEAQHTDNLPPKPWPIYMHGLGLFGCRKDAWLGFNKDFNGFGGEEGYIHEKFRKNGRRILCLPFLKWVHRFGTIKNTKSTDYPLKLESRIKNYLIGHRELGLDETPVVTHFGKVMCDKVREQL